MQVPMDFPRDEEWLELSSDPSYLVSTHGRLYDLTRRRLVERRLLSFGGQRSWGWNIREARSTQPSRSRSIRAARAVLEAFVGSGSIPVYADGDITNVRLDNLSWRKSMAEAG